MAKTPKEYKAGEKYVIPREGSLGLLALGYRGVKLWRARIRELDEIEKKQAASKEEE